MTSAGECAGIRQALGVYLLGAIGPADRAAVDRHLAGCAGCRDELAGLASLPGRLASVPAADVPRLGQGPRSFLDEMRSEGTIRSLADRTARMRWRWRRRYLAAALAVAAAAGGVAAAGVATRPGLPAVVSAAAGNSAAVGSTVRGSNPGSGAIATVRYVAHLWGLELRVQISGIPAGTRCQLWVVGPGGRSAVAGSWTIASYATGTWYPASSPLPATEVRAFVITSGHTTLVTVPVRSA